ncbi:MAG: chemotaxis protein CheX [Bdellovibrionota bacterium]
MTFSVEAKGDAALVRCPPELGPHALKDFVLLVRGWLNRPSKIYVFDFSEVTVLNPAFFRPFVLLYQGLKKANSFLATIDCRDEVSSTIRANGLDSVFNVRRTFEDALSSAGITLSPVAPKRPSINVQFVNPFIVATQNTIETQANTKLKAGVPYVKNESLPSSRIDIAGVITLMSNVFQGSIALCFPAKVFLNIYSSMTGEDHPEITQEIADAAGEILNIIFGQAKSELNKLGMKIEKAIPTVVRGNEIQVHHVTRAVAIVLPFETAAGLFHLEIGVDPI